MAEKDEKAENKSASILEQVADKLKNSGSDVASGVVDTLVNEEVEKRKGLVLKAIGVLENKEKELKKIKPDLVALDGEGKTVSENWSKGQLDKRNKLQQSIDKLNKALNNALENNDYEQLQNAVK